MGGFFFAVLIIVVMFGYSLSWEMVRLIRPVEPEAPTIVRGALQAGAFISVAVTWPLLTIWSLFRYRTPWPVTRGLLRLRPVLPLWWRFAVGGLSVLWLVGSFITTVIAPDLLGRGWQAAIYMPVSVLILVVVCLYTDEVPREQAVPIGAAASTQPQPKSDGA